jgi:DNA-binding beta-propeller fold protein YncE
MSAEATVAEKSFRAKTQPCSTWGYEADDHWAQLPTGWNWSEVAAVATDSQDRVFVFNRGDHPIIVFNRDGSFIRSWGEGLFARPHGIFIGPDDAVYCTDDLDHTVKKFSPEGELLLTLGTSGRPSQSGATSIDFRTIVRAAMPFHYPTNLALGSKGEIYVTDGYGNARVHKFSATGELLLSWGEPGDASGQFHVPHGIAVGRDETIYVADRENGRIQLFSPEGDFISQWTDVVRPCQIFIVPNGDLYVAELGFRAGMWPGTVAPSDDAPGGRLSIFDPHGELKARWGGGGNPCAPGDFFAPHGIWVDSHSDIYVAEVTMSAGGNRGLVPPTCHALQKFIRRRTTS